MDKLDKIGLDAESVKKLCHPDSPEQMQQQINELTAMVERLGDLGNWFDRQHGNFASRYVAEQIFEITESRPPQVLVAHDNAIRAEVEEETINRCFVYIGQTDADAAYSVDGSQVQGGRVMAWEIAILFILLILVML